ncbi:MULTISPECIES: hypothetical protein [unclassified Bradyrhizobium]|uniref:hypothetical protein n=1 Tax=unclassified Bradyrhizobium TaxID=2631580 RepID=UPI0004101394|nr:MULTISPECIES: hypothetical protein [unclassified Bradyrhizobium]MCK7669358.1 hypothetical protein [Bradyrhizobium sp. 2S1]
MPKFKDKDWVKSARVGSKGSFVGQIVGTSQGESIVRDEDRKKWLRAESELEHAEKKDKAA